MKRFLFFLSLFALIIGASVGCAGTQTLSTPLPLPSSVLATTAPTTAPAATATAVVSPSPQPPAIPSVTPSTQGATATPMTDPQLEKFVNDAKQDLATGANIPPDSITVKSITPQEWPNAALGCPLPGIMYIQVVTQGYIIVLTGGGRDWEYHAGGNRVELCDR